MWIEAIVLGLVIGLIRGGRISKLKEFRMGYVNLFLVGLVLQIAPFFLAKVDFIKAHAALISFVGYILVFFFLVLNYKKKGLPLMMLGTFMNIAVMLLNSLKMPIFISSTSANAINLKLSILSGNVVNYFMIDRVEGLNGYLSKFIAMPDFYPGMPVIGLADIIIALGVIHLIQNEISYKRGFFI